MPAHKFLKIITDASVRIPNAHLPGRSLSGKSAAGIVFVDSADQIVHQFGRYLGEMTVPQAEYTALTIALDMAGEYCRKEIEVWMDADLVVKQLNGVWALRSDNLKPLFDKVKTLQNRFESVRIHHHPRTAKFAKLADSIANQTMDHHLR